MYDKHLKTFLTVADQGSLTRAAEILFLTPTALMKQINQLEADTGVKLFFRSPTGVTLTEAGKLYYNEGKSLIEHSAQVQDRARKAARSDIYTVYIGTSLLHPVQQVEHLLEAIALQEPQFEFYIVPYRDAGEAYARTLTTLGQHIDVLVSNYGFSNYNRPFNRILPLASRPIQLAVSKRHPLAAKQRVELADLADQTIYLPRLEYSKIMKAVLLTLRRAHAKLQYVEGKSFDFTVYNAAARADAITLTLNRSWSPHPLLRTVPLEWDHSIPYGILYPERPNTSTKKFIQAAALLTGQAPPDGLRG